MNRDIDYLELAHELGIKGRQAGNQLFAKCPLHKDSSPSFSLNIAKGVWTCHFGCGPETGRDFPKLVQMIQGGTVLDAHRWIMQAQHERDPAIVLESINELLRETAPDNLLLQPDTPQQDAWAYYDTLNASVMAIGFLERGFTWETISSWGIRYDPYREAVVIPVYDYEQEFRGTVSRFMNPKPWQGKYQNNPGLPKQEILFGLSPQRQSRVIILVEGPLDAIWLQQHGLPSAALFGTSISSTQIKTLQRAQVGEVILMMDNPLLDEAGAKALGRIRTQLVAAGYLMNQIATVDYPPPDSVRPEGYKDANNCDQEQLNEMLRQRHIFI